MAVKFFNMFKKRKKKMPVKKKILKFKIPKPSKKIKAPKESAKSVSDNPKKNK